MVRPEDITQEERAYAKKKITHINGIEINSIGRLLQGFVDEHNELFGGELFAQYWEIDYARILKDEDLKNKWALYLLEHS